MRPIRIVLGNNVQIFKRFEWEIHALTAGMNSSPALRETRRCIPVQCTHLPDRIERCFRTLVSDSRALHQRSATVAMNRLPQVKFSNRDRLQLRVGVVHSALSNFHMDNPYKS